MSSDSISSPETVKKILAPRVKRANKQSQTKLKNFSYSKIFGTLLIAISAVTMEMFARNRDSKISEQQTWNVEFISKKFDLLFEKSDNFEKAIEKQNMKITHEIENLAAKIKSLSNEIIELKKDDVEFRLNAQTEKFAAEVKKEVRDVLVDILRLEQKLDATKKAVKGVENSYALYRARAEFAEFAKSFNPTDKNQVPQLEEF